MKGFLKFLLAALCALFVFAACDKETPETNEDGKPDQETPVTPPEDGPEDPGENPEDPGENPEDPGTTPDDPIEDVVPDLEIPDVLFEGYYYGDYYEVGSGNAGVNFIEGSLGMDDWGDYVGSGTIICVDLNFELQDDPDHAVVPAGTYVMDEEESYAPGTWGLSESYMIKVIDGEAIYDEAGFIGGTVTVSKDAAGYKYVLDLTIEDGEKLSLEYVGPAKLINSTEEGVFSNLSGDITVPNLTQASMFCLGDIFEDGTTESWAISIGDKYYDLLTDYGPGYSMLLYFNLEPGLSEVPAGTYTDFVDPLTGEGLAPDTLLGGLSMLGMYMGCYYMCPVLTEEASLQSGSVTVAVDGDIYTITGTLYDGHENEVSFKYEGEVEKMIYEEYAVKSLSGKRGMLSKKPSFVKVR